MTLLLAMFSYHAKAFVLLTYSVYEYMMYHVLILQNMTNELSSDWDVLACFFFIEMYLQIFYCKFTKK